MKGVLGISRIYGYLQSQALYIDSAKIEQDLATLEEKSFELLLGRDILFGGLID